MAGARIQLKRATASQWTSANTVLFAGEIGYETDTNKFKIGDGTAGWTSLSYFNGNLSGSNLNDLLDVTITSAANGDFLRWNGTAWVNDAVNLSTDTVGSFVESLVAGTGVTLSNNSGEGATPTIAIGQAVATNSNVTFNDLTVSGNLTVSGTTTTINSTAVNVKNQVVFEGATDDNFETTLTVVDPTADRTITFPDATTTVVGTDTTQTLTNKTLTSPKVNENVVLTSTATELNILDGATLSTTELNYVDGVTSAIQTQLDAKAPLASPTFTGSVTLPDNTVALGTKTTGDYVATITGGTGVSSTAATTGEGTTHTLSIGQAIATTDSPTFAGLTVNGASVVFEGATANDFETTLTVTDPTADRTITLPDATGTVVTTGDTGTITSTMIVDGTIVNADVNASAAIALSKLASGTSAQVIVADGSGIPTYATLTGDVTISNTGVTSIAANSVALGTDTTGNYVNDVTAGTGVTVTHTPGEGSSPTVAIGQSVATSASPTFANVTISSVPTSDTHAATKAYVDYHAAGIVWHDAVKLATNAVLPGTPTYSNGTSGVGATLTATANARLSIDGANATTNDRVLVKDQADATQNGVYKVTAQGSVSVPYVLTRATDFDTSTPYEIIGVTGDAVYISSGSYNANQGYITTSTGTGTDGAHVLGTDNLTFSQFTGTATFSAGTGIAISGNTINVQTANAGRIVVNADDIDLATVARTNTSGSAGKSFIQSFATDSYGRVTGAVTADTAITLGTDTSGSYVESLVAGTGITLSNNSGEGATPTVTVDSAVIQARVANVTDTEIGYLDGVTSAIQTQIDTKAPIASPTFTGTVTIPSGASISGFAPLASPTFTGTPTLPSGTIATTQTASNNSTALATTAYVDTADALKANLASPTFTGTPTLPTGTIATTQTASDSTTAVATTAFVTAADNLKANIASPTFTGTPAAPTAAANANTTQIATTAYVDTADALKANLASPTFTGTPTLPTGTIATTQTASNNTTAVATTAYVDAADALKANLASPTFTGTPTLPTGTIATTQTAANSTTAVATTAFVTTADNLKANLASPTFTGTVTIPAGASISGFALLASPAFTGTPTSTTAAVDTNTTQVATTAYVVGQGYAKLASPTFTGTVAAADLTLSGNLIVNGTTTTVNSTTLTVDDKNIELGSIASPTDVGADGGGITLKGTTDKTLNWVDATDAWTSSEHLNLLTGKAYYINGTSVLSATTLGSAVTGSSLTSVGTIATGTWQGTLIGATYGGTGVNNGANTLTLAGNVSHAGAFTQTFTATATTSVTLPTTGTLATLAGTETLTNKTLTSPTTNTPTLTLSTSTSTTAGRIAYDSTALKLIVGDGTTAREYASSTIIANAQTASYTAVLGDKDKLVEMNVASGNTLTVPPNVDVAFPIGTQIRVLQTNTGQCTLTAGAGVTINGTPGLKLRTQWASATLIKRATNTWVAVGDLSA